MTMDRYHPWLVVPWLLSMASCVSEAAPMTQVAPACQNNVVITGYWPPSNEMLRQWSTEPDQNKTGWQGSNWQGLGYNVYSYFPEFPPDGEPAGDPIGSPESVGSAMSDLRVDYEDTSNDFWRIVHAHQPRILITTSRGGDIDWELEAVEGGHGPEAGSANSTPAKDWASDRHGAITHPTQDAINPRSWAAISTYRAGNRLPSQLPLLDIHTQTAALGIAQVQIDHTGTSGNYLSGFMGLHGLYYNKISPHNVAAGHIHVGRKLDYDVARELMETTLRVVLEAHPPQACAISSSTAKN